MRSLTFITTGDCKSFIHLWEPASDSSWNIDSVPYVGHTASVEDLQVEHFGSATGYLETMFDDRC